MRNRLIVFAALTLIALFVFSGPALHAQGLPLIHVAPARLMPDVVAIQPILLASPEPPQAGSGHSVSLSWTASADAAANPSLTYSVYRAATCSGTFAKINSSVATTSYVDGSLQPGTYCYQVTASLNGAESVPSNQAPAVILPAAPTNTKVTGTT